ncbi:hypothetical protein EZS27_013753 [termite gut metagenome]|uniref:Uncharacterized protein n=1 Tax=termite gut metagenome TaxID=433724 RepID=A0A5J4RW99_9ZZZZ
MRNIVFKSQNQGEILLFPPSLEKKIPQDSPSRLVNQLVEDLSYSKIGLQILINPLEESKRSKKIEIKSCT